MAASDESPAVKSTETACDDESPLYSFDTYFDSESDEENLREQRFEESRLQRLKMHEECIKETRKRLNIVENSVPKYVNLIRATKYGDYCYSAFEHQGQVFVTVRESGIEVSTGEDNSPIRLVKLDEPCLGKISVYYDRIFVIVNSQVHVYNLTGEKLDAWTKISGNCDFAIHNGCIYVPSYVDQKISVYSLDGKLVGKITNRIISQLHWPPYISFTKNDHILLSQCDNGVHCVHRETGQTLWSTRGFSAPCGIDTSTDGLVFVASISSREQGYFLLLSVLSPVTGEVIQEMTVPDCKESIWDCTLHITADNRIYICSPYGSTVYEYRIVY